MNDNEIIEQLTNDAQEWGLECELDEFINDNPDLTATEHEKECEECEECKEWQKCNDLTEG